MSAIGLGIAGAGLIVGGVESDIEAHKANQIQAGLKDPTYNIPEQFYQNREIARQMAQIGLPQQQYNNATNNIDQNQAAAITALNRSGNPGAGITSVVRQGNQAKAKLDAEDAQARENNQRYFINQNAQVGNQELAKQQSDVFDKFTRDFNQMQAYRGASQQNLNNTISSAEQLGLAGINYASNNQSSSQGQSPTPGVNAAAVQDAATTTGQIGTQEQQFNQWLKLNPQMAQ